MALKNSQVLNDLYTVAKSKRIVKNKEEFAKALDYSRGQLHRFMTGIDEPDDELIALAIGLVDMTKSVPHETLKSEIKEQGADKEISDKDLTGLIESQVNLSVAQRNATKTNTDIAEIMKARQSIANASPGKFEAFLAKFPALLVLLAEIGVGKTWKSKPEGWARLYNEFSEFLPTKEKGGNVSDAHK